MPCKFKPGDRVQYIPSLYNRGPEWQSVEVVAKTQKMGRGYLVHYENSRGFDGSDKLVLVSRKPRTKFEKSLRSYIDKELAR